MNTAPLTTEQYRKLAEANRKFAGLCIDPDVASEYLRLAAVFDRIAIRLQPLAWAFRGQTSKDLTSKDLASKDLASKDLASKDLASNDQTSEAA